MNTARSAWSSGVRHSHPSPSPSTSPLVVGCKGQDDHGTQRPSSVRLSPLQFELVSTTPAPPPGLCLPPSPSLPPIGFSLILGWYLQPPLSLSL